MNKFQKVFDKLLKEYNGYESYLIKKEFKEEVEEIEENIFDLDSKLKDIKNSLFLDQIKKTINVKINQKEEEKLKYNKNINNLDSLINIKLIMLSRLPYNISKTSNFDIDEEITNLENEDIEKIKIEISKEKKIKLQETFEKIEHVNETIEILEKKINYLDEKEKELNSDYEKITNLSFKEYLKYKYAKIDKEIFFEKKQLNKNKKIIEDYFKEKINQEIKFN